MQQSDTLIIIGNKSIVFEWCRQIAAREATKCQVEAALVSPLMATLWSTLLACFSLALRFFFACSQLASLAWPPFEKGAQNGLPFECFSTKRPLFSTSNKLYS